MISSADIGLCFYPSKYANDLLAGFSSEKLARYLLCGLPVVAFKYPSFVKSVSDTGSRLCLERISDLPQACKKIMSNYQNYKEASFKTYNDYFSFTPQFDEIIRYIRSAVIK